MKAFLPPKFKVIREDTSTATCRKLCGKKYMKLYPKFLRPYGLL